MSSELQVSAPAMPAPTQSHGWGHLRHLPLRLAVSVDLQGVRFSQMRKIGVGDVLASRAASTDDVPVYAGGALVAWATLDNQDGRMAIRLKRMA